MIRRFVSLLLLTAVLGPAAVRAQGVAINTSGAPADTSALLDLTSTAKGLLPPRMNALQRAAIVLPATGLVVYQTDGVQGLWYNAGTPLAPSWKVLVDNTSIPSSSWLASGANLYYSAGSVAIGTTSFAARLTVSDDLNGLRVATGQAGGALASFGGLGTFFVDAPFVPGGRLAILENGNTGVGVTNPQSRLDVFGGNGDLAATEGDLRVGTGLTRLKFGINTSGGQTGGATIMEQGPNGSYNTLSLGTQGNKVLHVNGATGRVGIGTDTPNAPLGFPATLGKKITLYPGATGDVGLAVAGNRLQIYADNPNADVALGYDQAGTFNERFAVKPTGALAVNGNTGSSGQVLRSNGAAAAATWVSPTNTQFNNITTIASSNFALVPDHGAQNLPDLTVTVNLTGTTKIIVSAGVRIADPGCALCGSSTAAATLRVDGTDVREYWHDVGNGEAESITFMDVIVVGAGSHTLTIAGKNVSGGKQLRFGDQGPVLGNSMSVQVVPQ